MLKTISERRGEAGLPGGERDGGGCEAGQRDREREQRPEDGRIGADREDETAAEDDPHGGSPHGAQGALAGAQGAGAQDGERAEHDPERMVDSGQARREDRRGRAPTAPRTLMCSQTDWRAACAPARSPAASTADAEAVRPAAEQLVDEAPPARGDRQLDVRRDRRGRDAQLLGAKARLQRADESRVGLGSTGPAATARRVRPAALRSPARAASGTPPPVGRDPDRGGGRRRRGSSPALQRRARGARPRPSRPRTPRGRPLPAAGPRALARVSPRATPPGRRPGPASAPPS